MIDRKLKRVQIQRKDTMNLNSENNYINKIREITLKVVTNITVEPVIFFYAIGFGITTIISPSLYFDKICKVRSKLTGLMSMFLTLLYYFNHS